MIADTECVRNIRQYLEDPTGTAARSNIGSFYWRATIDALCSKATSRQELEAEIIAEQDFIDMGIFPKISPESNKARPAIFDTDPDYPYLHIFSFSTWILEQVKKIHSGDKKETMEREIKGIGMKNLRATTKRTEALQQKTSLIFGANAAQNRMAAEIAAYDTMLLDNMRTRRAVARGLFLDVESKRKLASQSQDLEKRKRAVEDYYNTLATPELRNTVKELCKTIDALSQEILETDDALKKKKEDLVKLEEECNTISPAEIEAKLRSELEFIRENLKLSSKRLKLDYFGALSDSHPHFTISTVKQCFDIILEFDPMLFHNDRVPIFGRPSILLIPGNGNGLFDWKNNLFIIPLSPPSGNFMISVASAVVEYRLDADEEKKLLYSYKKLPMMKDTRSLIALKEGLTRDYLKWVTSEYQGFKVLEKETRAWFEHEVAPSRTEIYCPPGYHLFELSIEETRNILGGYESEPATGPHDPSNLWAASIVYSQNGSTEQAYRCLKELSQKAQVSPFVYYNLGITASKTSRKQEAIDAFTTFM